ncbi:hypothetical protein MMC34_003858 [Xylographa carneopallida]|nr:hypothetical protein [Xylographa carneopallida]
MTAFWNVPAAQDQKAELCVAEISKAATLPLGGAEDVTQHSMELLPGQAPEWKVPPEQPLAVFLQIPVPLAVEQDCCTQHWLLAAPEQ